METGSLHASSSNNYAPGPDGRPETLAQRVTDAMVEEAGTRREAVVVTFIEVSKESYASGGVLMADKT
jgi:phenylpyruvate tautomerase PptA (4-oxalocrotonate tautomerase family)